MKLIIAGGRDYQFTKKDWDRLETIRNVHEVVSGGARGADEAGEAWAAFRQKPIKRFMADWEKFGKRAGPMRNREMAEYADAVALFPGGKGTQNMYLEAKARNLVIYDFRNDEMAPSESDAR